MHKRINTKGFKAGTICRMRIVDFMNYTFVELWMSPYLNIIQALNETGKSTFVRALILGLCGNMESIEPDKKVSEYIREGFEKAVITIEIYQEPDEQNVTLTRVINRNELSKWYVDGESVSPTQFKDITAGLNIKIGSIWQMLAQDRMKYFAHLNPQSLLENTISAIGENNTLKDFIKLKNRRITYCRLTNKIQEIEKDSQYLVKSTEILQRDVDNHCKRVPSQKMKIEKEIKICECKKLWIEERILRKDLKKCNSDKLNAESALKTHKDSMQRLEDNVMEFDNEIKQMENDKLILNAQIKKSQDMLDHLLKCSDIEKRRIEENTSWFLNEKKKLEILEKEIKEETEKLHQMQSELEEANKVYGDEAQMNSELAKLSEHLRNLEKQKRALMEKKQDIVKKFEQNVFLEIERYRKKISELKDLDSKRLQKLSRYNSDTYQAVLWLRTNNNKQLFKGPVCEPIMMEVKFPDHRYAKYFEAIVSRKDLISFTFLHAEDMILFLKKVRMEQGLTQVNTVCCQQDIDRPPYKSPDISGIRKYGFSKYLVETFTAHEMIVKYLCRQYDMHKIPIGNEDTNDCVNLIPGDISLFFTDNYRFSSKAPKYSKERMDCTDISPPTLLADFIDVDKVNQNQARLLELQRQEQLFLKNKGGLDAQLQAAEVDTREYTSKQTVIHDHIKKRDRLCNDIERLKVHLEKKKEPLLLLKLKQKDYMVANQNCVDRQLKFHKNLMPILDDIYTQSNLSKLLGLALQKALTLKVQLEQDFQAAKEMVSAAKVSLNEKEQLVLAAIPKAADKLKEALQSSSNIRPEDRQFPNRNIYMWLPDHEQELRQHMENLRYKLHALNTNDVMAAHMVKQLEEDKNKIERLTKKEVNMRESVTALQFAISKGMENFIPFVLQLVGKINHRFREMFQRIGVEGQVRFNFEDEIVSYGLTIKVKYHGDDSPRELNSLAAPGEENDLCTAVYILALQHEDVPFRCVDMINEGMDPLSETKFFEMLIKDTSQEQLFFISPKLEPAVESSENVKIHSIMMK